MPLNTMARIYRKRIVGNPWLYHAKWWVKDVLDEGKIRAKIEAVGLRDFVIMSARNVPFTARVVRDLVGDKIRNTRRDRQRLPRP